MHFKSAIGYAIIFLTVLYLIKAFNLSYPLTITNLNTSGELSVVGEGQVDVRPDTAQISAGISVSNLATVAEVKKNINDTNNKIIASLTPLGVGKKDIKTSNYSISPFTDQNKITVYSGSVNVVITVHNPELASKVIEEVTKAGANEISASQFFVTKPEKYREEARNLAITNAKEQAQKLAASLGIKLGKITNIVEASPYTVPPLYSLMKTADGSGGAAQIEPGSQTVTSVVTLYFEKR
ncbi:SIMPL domain-containing protein [Candidatus Roizmanbacteria bacterium]|nr:SIMPL domain-containing protein [Candidatus Roizmanbacteria bacterium]